MKYILHILIIFLVVSCNKTKTDIGLPLTGQYQSNLEKTKAFYKKVIEPTSKGKINYDRLFGVLVHQWDEENWQIIINKKSGTIFSTNQKPIINDYQDFKKISNSHFELDDETELFILSKTEYYIQINDPRLTTKEYFTKIK